ncbi:hypothetical protein LCL97_19980 [Seohaeicola saemankumensis]|nr:adenylate/guanylate cyclase domain-containing protein [Seohaeicola saemankumensis]MCA0873116.1 hypothetical protein [Seohaeicola saemankumensis]
MLDVYGFSRLMAADESGTLARVLKQQRDIIQPLIASHDGRVVKLMGDGVLAEFPSVTAAVQSAVEIQKSVARQAEDSSADADPLLVRIGINLGEVIADGTDIYGDGVNVAARIEALAQPGGIALSGAAHAQLKIRPPLNFEDMGLHQVKNIPEPVQVFHLGADLAEAAPRPAAAPAGVRRKGGLRAVLMAGCVAAVLAGGGWVLFGQTLWPGAAVADPIASFDPDKPSVVVLPFDDLTGQSDQKYFSDGITDNLITDLSRVGSLLVIARHTSFAYQDKDADLGAVARDLGVKYVVTGSVQRASGRVRINARVTEADTGVQLWADRFDRDASDLFALQDEVTSVVVSALQVELTQEEERLLALQDTDSVEAYDHYLKARSLTLASTETDQGMRTRTVGASAADTAATAQALDQALSLDPDFTRAQALMQVQSFDLTSASLLGTAKAIGAADAKARVALDQGDILPKLYSIHAMGLLFEGKYRKAIQNARQSVIVDPNYAYGFATLGWVLQFAGQSEDALRALQIARRLDPHWPALYAAVMAEVQFSLGDDAAAVEAAETALAGDPRNQRARLYRAAALANLGRFDEAAAGIADVLEAELSFGLDDVPAVAPYQSAETLNRLVSALRLAGLPDDGASSG